MIQVLKILLHNYLICLISWLLMTWWCKEPGHQQARYWPSFSWILCASYGRLTHWGRVTHICFSKLTIIGSDNGLSPGRRQAIIWTNAGVLLIGPIGTNLSEILITIHTFSFKKMHLKMSCGKCRPFWLGLNVLRWYNDGLLSYLITSAIVDNCLSQSQIKLHEIL